MSDYQIITPSGLIGYPSARGAASNTASVAAVPVGFCADGYHSALGRGEFVYAENSNVASRGQFVHVHNGSAVLAASGASASAMPIGVVAAGWTTTGTGQYGWVQMKGNVDYARGTNASIAAGVPLYLCSVAGNLMAASVAGNRVQGVVCPVSYTSSQNASQTVNLNGAAFVNGATAVL